ncbi:hypothetical protein F3Y22_tig00110694pilonHSYRG00324 [Hibiscus syriacus]|uniref:Uncharacterized protein n=1 Tax=Hibiscus syriacus TaxID=106335 RepID=A0A6A2ZWA8_HIBSY|nr:hypothetical protein F3Y22_tig00110694pilonHSYRG00324 [Hibiscus syriacus]
MIHDERFEGFCSSVDIEHDGGFGLSIGGRTTSRSELKSNLGGLSGHVGVKASASIEALRAWLEGFEGVKSGIRASRCGGTIVPSMLGEKWVSQIEDVLDNSQEKFKVGVKCLFDQVTNILDKSRDHVEYSLDDFDERDGGVMESCLDKLESMEDMFKDVTQHILNKVDWNMVYRSDALENEVVVYRNKMDELKRELLICKGTMSEWEVLAIAKSLTELVGDKPNNIESSILMPRDNGNSGGDWEESSGKNDKVKFVVKKKLKCYFCDGPNVIRGYHEKNHLATIVRRIDEPEREVARLGAIACVDVIKPRKRCGATTISKVVNLGSKHDNIVSVKVVKHGERLSAIAKDKVVKLRVKREQLKCYRCKGPHKLRKCPNELIMNKGADDHMSKKALKELAEYVEKNMASETTIRQGSKGVEPRRDVATMEPPLGKMGEKNELDTSKSVNGVRLRVRVKQIMGHQVKGPCVLRVYLSKVELYKVMDEPKIEVSKENEELGIKEALRLSSILFVSVIVSGSQVQKVFVVPKKIVVHVCVKNMASKTTVEEGSKEVFTEDVRGKNNPLETISKSLPRSPELAYHLENIVESVHIGRADKENDIISEDDHKSSVNMVRDQKRLWRILTISSVNTYPMKHSY